ncbi:MAG TPA: hypothetical protein VJB90_01470 [Candidatus Nanoarchaeia archaeon]|nr:hypothetical protein [Candidatus Nanoarchaeia archaeon]
MHKRTGFLLKFLIISAALVYLAVCLRYYLEQSDYIYEPDNSSFFDCNTSAQKIEVNGTRLYFVERSDAAMVVYHGRGGSACNLLSFDNYAESLNYSFIAVEYFGYAPAGKPSQKLIENDVKNAVSFMNSKSLESYRVIGKSLGSAMAAYHVNLISTDKLILFSPFDSLASIGEMQYPYLPIRPLLRDKYDVQELLSKRDGKTIIIFAQNDTLIPPSLSIKLYESLKGEKKLIVVPNATHETLYYDIYDELK